MGTMRIPELSYPNELDTLVTRRTTIVLGEVALSIDATTISGKPRPNEDAFAFSRQGDTLLAGVFDGAVGRQVSDLARHYMEDGDAPTARDALSGINTSLGSHDLNGGGSTGTILEIVGGIRPARLNLAHVSDSWAILEHPSGEIERLTQDQHAPFDTKALAVLARVATEQDIPLTAARHDPEVEEALAIMFRTSRNTPDGSGAGILNGSPHMDQYIQTLPHPINLQPGSRLLIGSDGSKRPVNGDHRFALESMLHTVRAYGTQYYLAHLRVDEAEHPPTARNPRWSLHDDKTLIDIQVL